MPALSNSSLTRTIRRNSSIGPRFLLTPVLLTQIRHAGAGALAHHCFLSAACMPAEILVSTCLEAAAPCPPPLPLPLQQRSLPGTPAAGMELSIVTPSAAAALCMVGSRCWHGQAERLSMAFDRAHVLLTTTPTPAASSSLLQSTGCSPKPPRNSNASSSCVFDCSQVTHDVSNPARRRLQAVPQARMYAWRTVPNLHFAGAEVLAGKVGSVHQRIAGVLHSRTLLSAALLQA